MKVAIQQIDPGGSRLSGVEERDILELDERGLRPLSPVAYELDVGLSDGGIFASGRLSVEMQFDCVRCGEPFRMRVAVDDFAIQEDLHGADSFDLTPAMREEIVLGLPAYPRCDQHGGLECHGPGAASQADDGAADAGSDDRWSVLDNLTLPKKN